MGTVLIIVLFIVGLVLTIKGGDWFVDAATWLAEATGIPKFIIGATVVGKPQATVIISSPGLI